MFKLIKKLENISIQVRRDVLRMIYYAKSGHPGGSLSATDMLVVLYFHIMNHSNKFSIDGINEDIFFLSNGHISSLWYSVLARCGYFPLEELKTFRKINSRLQGHPTNAEELPGIRISSGSLGQGLSVALGAALSKKINNDKKIIYIMLGDGELQEGQIWEAAMFAAHYKIDNIISIIDCNGKQIDGNVDDIISLENLYYKWQSFGWNVVEIYKGNNIENIIIGVKYAKSLLGNNKPIVILLKTQMGYGVDFMVDDHNWHGMSLNEIQIKKALNQLKTDLKDY
ncbi:MAG: transketolase [Bacteroides sp.]|nr:MAG: transketolase [Bacteroides sp.]